MEQILRRQEARLQSGQIAIDEDSKFHAYIALAAKNGVVLKVLDILMDLLRKTRERSLQTAGRQQKSLAGHRRILAALTRGNAAAAEAAMHQHLEEIENFVLEKL
jgi:GntR family transcriptional repressor for pyruvate dehydrogenase complex